MNHHDRRLIEKITERPDKGRRGMDEVIETIKEFGIGFFEGALNFLQNLMPGGSMRQLHKCDRRNPPKDEAKIDFTPEKIFHGIPVKEDQKMLEKDSGLSDRDKKSRGMLPHHRRT